MKRYHCTAWDRYFDEESADVCPYCGSVELNTCISIYDKMNYRDRVSGKVRKDGTKKPRKEFIYGADYSKGEHKYMDKTRIIDRENNQYYESVIDPDNGETIHKCEESLTEHFGHGSAKRRC